MAMISVLSAKGAPGVTTGLAVLASVWPSKVVVADCDPHGGDLAVGWLAQWWLSGWLRDHRGVLSFATATRHATTAAPELLSDHLQTVPPAPHVELLVGLRDYAQTASITDDGWRRLANVLAGLGHHNGQSSDVLVDCGRFGPTTPWQLLTAADLVLVAARPTQRHILAARSVVNAIGERIPPSRLGLAMCGATPGGARDAQRVLALSAGLILPYEPGPALFFSDGIDVPRLRRSALVRAAATEARRLHATLNSLNGRGVAPERRNGTAVQPVIGARP